MITGPTAEGQEQGSLACISLKMAYFPSKIDVLPGRREMEECNCNPVSWKINCPGEDFVAVAATAVAAAGAGFTVLLPPDCRARDPPGKTGE